MHARAQLARDGRRAHRRDGDGLERVRQRRGARGRPFRGERVGRREREAGGGQDMSRCGSIGWSFGPSWLEVCRGTEVRGVRRARRSLRGTGLDADADDPQAAVEQDPAVVGTVAARRRRSRRAWRASRCPSRGSPRAASGCGRVSQPVRATRSRRSAPPGETCSKYRRATMSREWWRAARASRGSGRRAGAPCSARAALSSSSVSAGGLARAPAEAEEQGGDEDRGDASARGVDDGVVEVVTGRAVELPGTRDQPQRRAPGGAVHARGREAVLRVASRCAGRRSAPGSRPDA